jgi:hypothetical protein
MRAKFKRAIKIITSKTFLGALGFSIALWLYITLNTVFVSFVKVPLKIHLPADKSIEKPIPDYISVEVRATGWEIFNLDYLNSAAECNIDLSGVHIDKAWYTIARSDIIKNLENMGNVQAIDVVPQSIDLKLGKIGEYSVVVEPDVEIKPREGYVLVGEVTTVPDLITIRGNDKKIRGTTRWKTVHMEFEDLTSGIETKLPLSDTLSNIIKLSTREVVLRADVQKLAEITIEDIPLLLNGAKLPYEHEIYPQIFDITLRGGIKEIENLNYDEIIISVNTTDVVNDTTGIVKPHISLPKNIECIKISPPYIEHTKIIKGEKLSRLK